MAVESRIRRAACMHVGVHYNKNIAGTSLVVQQLGLCAFIAKGEGVGTKILQATQRSQINKLKLKLNYPWTRLPLWLSW